MLFLKKILLPLHVGELCLDLYFFVLVNGLKVQYAKHCSTSISKRK